MGEIEDRLAKQGLMRGPQGRAGQQVNKVAKKATKALTPKSQRVPQWYKQGHGR